MAGESRRVRIAAVLAGSAAIVSAVDFVLIAFFSRYFNYGGESVGLYGLLRVARGLPYLGTLGELPAIANPYGPYPLFIVGWPLRLLGVTSPYWTNVAAKFFILVVLGLNAAVCGRILGLFRGADRTRSRTAWMIAVLYPILFNPLLTFSFRPDLLGVLFELLGFFVIAAPAAAGKGFRARDCALAGALFAVAATSKANHVGVFAGTMVALWIARGWKPALACSAAWIASTALLSVALTGIAGESLWIHVLHAANFGSLSIRDLPGAFTRIADEVFFRHFAFHLAALAGILVLPRGHALRTLFLGALAGTLTAAVLGQLKVGAYNNYFYSYFLLAAAPAAMAISELARRLGRESGGAISALAGLGAAGIMILVAYGAIPAAAILANDMRNYPYGELERYLAEKHPTGFLYAADENVAVHLADRVAFAPWAERCYVNSPYLRERFLPGLRERLKPARFEAAVASGKGCELWKPSGELAGGLSQLTRLGARFGKLCVFESGISSR